MSGTRKDPKKVDRPAVHSRHAVASGTKKSTRLATACDTCAGIGGVCLALCALLLPAPAFAITEAQFIEKVLAQDKLLEEAQIGLDIKQIELDASRDNYANWKAELSVDVDYERTNAKRRRTSRRSGNFSTSSYAAISKETPREIALEFDKRFLSNPASLTAGISRERTKAREVRYKNDKYSGEPTHDGERTLDGYDTVYYAQVTYPLLKHDGNAESLKTYHRNILDLQDQQLSFFETKEDFLNDRLDDYLSWVRHQAEVEINRELLAKLHNLRPSDAAATALLNSAIAQAENFERDAGVEMQAIKERLAVLLDDASILHETPEFDLQKRIDLVPGDLRAYLSRNSRALQRINIDMQLNELEIAYHKNRLLPSLDLTLRAEKTLNGTGTFTSAYDDDTTEYEVNLEFSYPLGGSITTKAELARRTLSTRRLEIAYAERMERIEADLQRLASLLDLDETRLLSAIEAARQSARIEQKNHDLGRASFRDLVQAYRDERVAKLDHLDNLIDYHTNSIEYDNLLDRIIKDPCPQSPAGCAP